MSVKEGFPPGYDFRAQKNNPNRKSSDQEKAEKRAQAIQDLRASVPENMIKGDSISYDNYGLPVVEEESMNPSGGDDIQAQMKAALQGKPNRQGSTPKPPQAFFGGESAREQHAAEPTREDYERQYQQGEAQYAHQEQKNREYNESLNETQKSVPEPVPEKKKYEHPVVKRLLNKFGLKKYKRHVLEVFEDEKDTNPVRYTMTLVPEDLSLWALNEAKDKDALEGYQTAIAYFEMLLSCASIIAIDGVPVWQIFSVEPNDYEKLELANDEFAASHRMRKICARQLCDLLWHDTKPIGGKLTDFYEKVVNESSIMSSLDRANEKKIRYVCPVDGCTVVEILEEGEYFCKVHGKPLIPASTVQQERNIPLA